MNVSEKKKLLPLPVLGTRTFHAVPCHNKAEISLFSTPFNAVKFKHSSLNVRNIFVSNTSEQYGRERCAQGFGGET